MKTLQKTVPLLVAGLMLAVFVAAQTVIQNRTYEGGETEQRNTTSSISTADNVLVKPAAKVEWESLTQIHLTPGFHVQPGAYFDALVPDPDAFIIVVLDGDNQSASPGAVNARPFEIAAWQRNAPVTNIPITFTVKSGGGSLMTSADGAGASGLTMQSDIDGTVRAYYKQPTNPNVTSTIQVTSNGKILQLFSYNFATSLTSGNAGTGANGTGTGGTGFGDPNAPGNTSGNAPNWNVGKEGDNAAGFVVFSPEGDSTTTTTGGSSQAHPSMLLTRTMTGNNVPAPTSCGATGVFSTEYDVWKLFDGTTSGYYASPQNAYPNGVGNTTVWYSFGSARTLTRVVIKATNYADYQSYEPRDFTIYVGNSPDINTATPVYTAVDCPHAPAASAVQLDVTVPPTTGSYVFVKVTKIWSTTVNLNIGELELYGYDSAATDGSGYVSSGLIQYFDADNNTGSGHSATATTWKDISGYGNDGALQNYTSAAWQADSLPFNGSNQYVTTPLNLGRLTNSFTICSVVKMQNSGNYKGIAGEHTGATAANPGVIFGQWENNVIKFAFFGGPGVGATYREVTISVPSYNMPLNTAHSLTWVVEGGQTSRLYIDGQLYGTGAIVGGAAIEMPPVSTINMSLGRAFNSPDRYLLGNIYSFMVYNRALSDAEVSQNYNHEKARLGLP